MIHSFNFRAILDACVLYPIVLRDILLWFASHKLYAPLWSEEAIKEWENVMKRQGFEENAIAKQVHSVVNGFPNAMVTHYTKIIPSLELPDENDRHIMAAAIKVNANVIVTSNLKDFPSDYLREFGLTAKSPDDFLVDIIDLNNKVALEAFRMMVLHKRNPDLDEFEVLALLRNNNLNQIADYLHSLL